MGKEVLCENMEETASQELRKTHLSNECLSDLHTIKESAHKINLHNVEEKESLNFINSSDEKIEGINNRDTKTEENYNTHQEFINQDIMENFLAVNEINKDSIAEKIRQEKEDEEFKSTNFQKKQVTSRQVSGEFQRTEPETIKQTSLIESFKYMNTERSPKPPIKIQSKTPSKLKIKRPCKTKHKSIPCKKCQGCVRENCGKCANCRDMPKFGGKGTAKQKCIYRKCVIPVMSNCEMCRK